MQQILDTIRNYRMIRPGTHVLAGVSGGADSVCLLLALKEYQKECGFQISVVHVEHGIRGGESLEDARFVEELCRTLGVSCHVEHCDVPSLAASGGKSLEEAARDARYQIFDRLRRVLQAEVTAVAHNENDQAETVLWNLVRGSGLRGLGGMRPVRGAVIRPLLFTPRSRIEQILRERGVSWRTDRTNLETDYTRNRLRLELLPWMEEHLNRQAAAHIAESAGRLQEVQEYMDRSAAWAEERCVSRKPDGIALSLSAYQKEDPCIRAELLRLCLRRCAGSLKDVGSVHIRMLQELADMDCGKALCLPGGLQAVRQEDVILFCRAREEQQDCREFLLPAQGTLIVDGFCVRTERFDRETVKPEEIFREKKYTKWLSCDTIKGNVSFRKRRAGDYLVINARGGRKKLGDYMTDQKIPRRERDRMWLIAAGAHVLWLPGYRVSEAAKVTEKTETVLKITITIQTEERRYEGESQDSFAGAGSKSADRGDRGKDQQGL